MGLGLKRGTVVLEPNSEQWDSNARETIYLLESILGYDAIDIQHIGSTSIKNIMAKPIIDIAVGVRDFNSMIKHNEELADKGIIFRGQDVKRQLLYVMGDFENDTRTHHIHVVIWNQREWTNYINFRDYLNSNDEIALKYSMMKEELSKRYMNDRSSYTNGKQEMIDNILRQACKLTATDIDGKTVVAKNK